MRPAGVIKKALSMDRYVTFANRFWKVWLQLDYKQQREWIDHSIHLFFVENSIPVAN